MEYTLTITCPLCHTEAKRTSSHPFIYLDAQGIRSHAQHMPDCEGAASSTLEYTVEREPVVYRQLPGDPVPPAVPYIEPPPIIMP